MSKPNREHITRQGAALFATKMQTSVMSSKLNGRLSGADSRRTSIARPSHLATAFRSSASAARPGECRRSMLRGDNGNNSSDVSQSTVVSASYPHAARSAAGVRVQAKQATKEEKDGSSAARQMLGMKGASDETDIWKIRVQLTKPVTWIPLIWGE